MTPLCCSNVSDTLRVVYILVHEKQLLNGTICTQKHCQCVWEAFLLLVLLLSVCLIMMTTMLMFNRVSLNVLTFFVSLCTSLLTQKQQTHRLTLEQTPKGLQSHTPRNTSTHTHSMVRERVGVRG